jgi:integrase
MNITEKFLGRVQATAARQTFRDDEVTGFGVRVESAERGGRVSFFYNVKIAGQVVFKPLGEWPSTSVKAARNDAKELAGKASAWKRNGLRAEMNPFAKQKALVRTAKPMFRELVDAYIQNRLLDPESGALNKKRAEYDARLLVKNHLSSWLDLPIDKITTEDVLAARNAAKGRYMQNSVAEFVRRIYNWSNGLNKRSKDKGRVYWPCTNPAKDVTFNGLDKRERFLGPEELLRFNEELKKETNGDLRDVLTLLLATGARKSNVFAMRWREIDFDLGLWHVPMSKSGKGYDVPLTPAAIQTLASRRKKANDNAEFIFPSRSSATGHIIDVKKKWTVFRERAQIPDVRLHDLRRTKGSYAALSGESLQKIAAVLGHKSLGSTQIYARLNEEAARQASMAADATMEQMMNKAKKRLKRAALRPGTKLLTAQQKGATT